MTGILRLIALTGALGYGWLLTVLVTASAPEVRAPRIVALQIATASQPIKAEPAPAQPPLTTAQLVLDSPEAPVEQAAPQPPRHAEPSVEEVRETEPAPTAEPVPESAVESAPAGPSGLDVSQTPPKPDDDEAPPIVLGEKAGGRVLVLAVRIGSDGRVLDTRVLVPSYDTVGDMGYALAASQLYQPQIVPPVEPGKSRWLTLRIRYPDDPTHLEVLP